ncbi:hypothetical protein PQI07_27100 [Methylobacterium sp. 092160098-2]|uniref:hypothetical protein n=1 Tax=Methylobacterium sp. 092160098-2 TaxID=3025129 RepID=UPI002381CE5F|nr:hypothetical protein [Methylobacterium sp. 092160098-2]MDE4914342.1 hypothetical protein [Methylobacterium sp. 092160098-2]
MDEDDMSPMPRRHHVAENLGEGSEGREPMHPGGPSDSSLLRIVGGFFACAMVLAGLIRLLHAA